MQRLKGKVAVVTGAGRNIGRAEAMLLAEQGAKVVVNDFGGGSYGTEAGNATLAEKVAQEIRDAGGEAVAEHSSVATREGAEAAVQAAIDAFGRIDILVNNAGIVRPSRIDLMTDEDWHLCMNVSLTSSFHAARKAAQHMIAQRSGVIINTGSPSGFGHWGMGNYSAAKEGLLGFTRSIARELGEFGIRVNLIRPVSHITGTYTPEIQQTLDEATRLGQSLVWNKPVTMRTVGETPAPDHVAALVAWLCTDNAAHISGRDFYIAGEEISVVPEPEAIRTTINPGGWTLDALDEPATREYLFGDIRNRFVR
jgi:3-oxoacyl-[acyl-carrier protein] reductase